MSERFKEIIDTFLVGVKTSAEWLFNLFGWMILLSLVIGISVLLYAVVYAAVAQCNPYCIIALAFVGLGIIYLVGWLVKECR